MELVVGDTLKTLIQRVGPLPVTLVLDISLYVCEALDAAHKLGLIHRDIKPDNIVLIAQREGPPTAKILDFGISRLRHEATGAAKGLTQTGMVIGTPEYMSPEQVMGKKGADIDGRSDLYSLGIVMYRMLTGELPFTGETTVEMFLQHLHSPVQAPHSMKPELAIPESVSAIVMKAMDKDRDKRFATGADMAAAIRKARGSTTVSTKKIDWGSLSTATASFGAEKDTPGAPAAPRPAISMRPSSTPGTGPVGPTIERSAYRQPNRGGRSPDQLPLGKVIRLATVIILMVAALMGWKYYQSRRATRALIGEPARVGASEPASSPETAHPSEASPEPPRTNTGPTNNGVQRPEQRNDLTDAEKVRILELNNMGTEYYREGGCEKALPPFQKVLDIDPGNPTAYAAVRNCMLKARRGENIPTVPVTSPPQDSSPPPNR
jgi:serine/threonine protein kinase